MPTRRTAAMILALLPLVTAGALPARAQGLGVYDPALVWPLCGRISDDPPVGWSLGMDCPPERFGDAAFHDGPISSTFGPRQLPSAGFRYDFHRGIDLPAAIGTPIFAVADGEVLKAGPHPSFDDPVIEVRHFRPGFNTCGAGGGCYSSMYLHVSDWTVSPGELVGKGDYIGQTGTSASEFDHLHFEIRDAPPLDAASSWQKDCAHPLGALPYPDTGADNLALTLDAVDDSDPLHPLVTATVTIPMTIELDLERLEAGVWERQPGGALVPVPQPGDTPVGTTVEGDGYLVEPSSYSMNRTNRQYTYKDSGSGIGYEEFLVGGLYESPYAADLPLVYDPGFHMDAADPGDFQAGLFNGMRLAPIHYNDESPAYQATFQFQSLVGTASAASLCVKVRAVDARGTATPWVTHNCPEHSCPDAPLPGCRAADKALVQLKTRAGVLDRLKWVFKGGPATALGEFAEPVSDGATYSWCLWDDAGSNEPALGIDVPTGGECGGLPCWRAAGTKGFKFKDRIGIPGGITGMAVQMGDAGKTKLKVLGKGANLPSATLPLVVPLTAQLIVDDGVSPVCWQASWATAVRNDATQVKAK